MRIAGDSAAIARALISAVSPDLPELDLLVTIHARRRLAASLHILIADAHGDGDGDAGHLHFEDLIYLPPIPYSSPFPSLPLPRLQEDTNGTHGSDGSPSAFRRLPQFNPPEHGPSGGRSLLLPPHLKIVAMSIKV